MNTSIDSQINIEDFFAELEARGINIHLDEKGALRVKAKKDQLDKLLVDKLKLNKVAIFHWLKQQRAAEAPLSEEQRHHLVHGLNQAGLSSAASEAFGDLTIHGLFESKVVDVPYKIAVEYGTQKLTYAQLNQHANRLAFFLRHKGMATEALVGICFEPCVDMIVAMLAVLKAGGTYVPLNPDSSSAKLKQSEVEFVLTRKLQINLFSRFTTECYAIDDPQVSQAISCCASANPPLLETQSAFSLACVLFAKEGSGQTNGIMIEHGNVVRLVNKPNYLLLDDTDTVAQGTSTLYDPALFEIWGALCNGATLCYIEPPVWLNPMLLKQTLAQKQVTTAFVRTGLLNQLIEVLPDCFASLNTVIFGGEQVAPQTLEALAPLKLIQVYGPTENATFSTYIEISAETDINQLSIGKPISATTCYILNKQQRLVPQGEEGLLYMGGLGLARGYLNGWALTEERFTADPFSEDPNDKIFTCGDRARFLSDGNIELLDPKPVFSAQQLIKVVEVTAPKPTPKSEPVAGLSCSMDNLVYNPLGAEHEQGVEEEVEAKAPVEAAFYQPIWQSAPLTTRNTKYWPKQSAVYLIFEDNFGTARQISQWLSAQNQRVIRVAVGEQFTKINDSHFLIEASNQQSYQSLLASLSLQKISQCHVVHLWSLDAINVPASCEPLFEQLARFEHHQVKGLTSATFLNASFEQSSIELNTFTVVTHDTLSVTGDEPLMPCASTITATIATSINFPAHHIDLCLMNNNPVAANIEQLSQFVIDELTQDARQTQVVYRGKQRWLPKLSQCPKPPDELLNQRIRPNGVYIVIADDVETGLSLSTQLIDCDESVQVVMVGQWGDGEPSMPEKIAVCQASLTDFNAMETVFNEIRQDLGQIKGLVYAPGETQPLSLQVKRLLVLDTLLSQHSCDFCLLVSTRLGAPSVVKSAVNIYHDTFVHNKHNQGYEHWLSVTFDDAEAVHDKALFKQVLAMGKTAKLVYC